MTLKFLSFFLFTFVSLNVFSQTVFEQYPHAERFKLQSGDVVLLPLHLQNYDQVILLGSVDLTLMNQQLASQDLEALPVDGVPGRAQAAIFAFSYNQTDIGAYKEIILSIPVKEKNIPNGAAPKVGQYVWEIHVTTAFARRFGIDVWGLPKQLRSVTINTQGPDITVKAGLPSNEALS